MYSLMSMLRAGQVCGETRRSENQVGVVAGGWVGGRGDTCRPGRSVHPTAPAGVLPAATTRPAAPAVQATAAVPTRRPPTASPRSTSPDQHLLGVKQHGSQRLGQLRLAHSRGPQEQEGGAAVARAQAAGGGVGEGWRRDRSQTRKSHWMATGAALAKGTHPRDSGGAAAGQARPQARGGGAVSGKATLNSRQGSPRPGTEVNRSF